MTERERDRVPPLPEAVRSLETRVKDVEECLAQLCERLAWYVECRHRFRNAPTPENLLDLFRDLVDVIKSHELGS